MFDSYRDLFLMMRSFQNLQVVIRQQVEEFAKRLIFPLSQAEAAVSEKSYLYINISIVTRLTFNQSLVISNR